MAGLFFMPRMFDELFGTFCFPVRTAGIVNDLESEGQACVLGDSSQRWGVLR